MYLHTHENFFKSDIAVIELEIFLNLHYYCYYSYYFIIPIVIIIIIINIILLLLLLLLLILLLLLLSLLSLLLFIYSFIFSLGYVDLFGQKGVLLAGFLSWDVVSRRSKLALKLMSITPQHMPVVSA